MLVGYTCQEIKSLARVAGGHYSPFDKRARPRPFQRKPLSRKVRRIDNPLEDLKKIQRRIQRRLLRPLVLPQYLCGGVRGKTVLDAVMLHIGSAVLVKLDIRNFFPRITNLQVYDVWSKLLNCSPEISSLLTKLTTYERHVPQGAPTSSLLANLVLYIVDAPIRNTCKEKGVRYSSWVDDLAFSGDDAREVVNTAVEALRAGGFSVSHKKLRIMGPGDRKVLCGVLMGKFPNVVRERISNLRSGIHKLRAGRVPWATREEYLRALDGGIQQVATINARRGRALAEQLKAVIELNPSD